MASQEGISQNQTVDTGIDQRLQTRNLADTLARFDQCSAFCELIRGADLEYLLRHSGLRMLLAPNNEALANATPGDPEQFLNQHLFAGGMESFDLRRCQTVKNLNGCTLPVQVNSGTVRIGPANLVRTDIPCTNGVIHIVDAIVS